MSQAFVDRESHMVFVKLSHVYKNPKPTRPVTGLFYFVTSMPSEEINVIPVGRGIGVSVSMLSVLA